MRDPQEYDITDLLDELVSDALNFTNYIDMWQDYRIDWKRVGKQSGGSAWDNSVFKQYIEDCCGRHLGLAEEVLEGVMDNIQESQPLNMVMEADNYDHIQTVEDLDNLMTLIMIWIGEGVIKV